MESRTTPPRSAKPPLAPEEMPFWRHGRLRKRWRYVAAFAEDLMLCAARVGVGPFGQTFWVVWDRERDRRIDRTSRRRGGPEVTMDGPLVRIEAPELRAELRLGEVEPVEVLCTNGPGWGWSWTRKRAGMEALGWVETEGRRRELRGRGVDDESAGYHERHTAWHWSAGVGLSTSGDDVAWNLVTGINDQPQGSERAVWVGGVPREPEPVAFDDLDWVGPPGRPGMRFASGCERERSDDALLIRSRYRMRFGTFSGRLPGGPDLADGLGVMEEHEAVW